MKDKVVLAYSGGLDTSYCACYLTNEKQLEVHAVLVNTGGFLDEEIRDIEKRAASNGAHRFVAIDVQNRYYDECLKYLIYGNVLRNHTYPLSVSAERLFQAIAVVEYAKEVGAKYIAHGSTGAGNDQVRFDLNIQVLAPDIEIITPIRDQSLSRAEEIDYLTAHGIQLDWQAKDYSINKGLWGTSVGGKETLTSHQSLPDHAFPTQLKKREAETLTLHFTNGELSGLEGETGEPVDLIRKLNKRIQPFALGRDIHVGDTIMGIKGRVGFEAGGPTLIIKAHQLLEKHILTKWQLYWKDQLSTWYGMQVHEGLLLDPSMRDIEAYLKSSQNRVTGKVFIRLSPYRFDLLGIESPFDLMQSKYGLYGEKNTLWSAEEAKGFIKINSVPLTIYHSLNDEQS